MADDNTDTGGGQGSSDAGTGKPDAGKQEEAAVKAAEKRAREAEQRAAAAEEKARKQEEADKRRKRDADLKDIDAAKKAIAEAEKRAEEAERRAKEADTRYRARIQSRYDKLPQETRDRLADFEAALPADKWEKLVDMEFERADTGTPAGDDNGVPPVGGGPAGRRIHTDRGGRNLHPKTVEILDELGIDMTAAKTVLEAQVENEGGQRKGRFVYPQKKLRRQLKERRTMPTALNAENLSKILSS